MRGHVGSLPVHGSPLSVHGWWTCCSLPCRLSSCGWYNPGGLSCTPMVLVSNACAGNQAKRSLPCRFLSCWCNPGGLSGTPMVVSNPWAGNQAKRGLLGVRVGFLEGFMVRRGLSEAAALELGKTQDVANCTSSQATPTSKQAIKVDLKCSRCHLCYAALTYSTVQVTQLSELLLWWWWLFRYRPECGWSRCAVRAPSHSTRKPRLQCRLSMGFSPKTGACEMYTVVCLSQTRPVLRRDLPVGTLLHTLPALLENVALDTYDVIRGAHWQMGEEMIEPLGDSQAHPDPAALW